MAYDEDLAHRIRELLGSEQGVREEKMFGGLAFLVGGNFAIAASGRGGVLVRVDPAEGDRVVAKTHADVAVMQGRPTPGWLRVDAEHVATKRQLERWVKLAACHARTLPVKAAGTR